MSEPEVLTRIDGAVGRITLNRPRALHALNLAMCEIMTRACWPGVTTRRWCLC